MPISFQKTTPARILKNIEAQLAIKIHPESLVPFSG